ncbi:hypothetical protein FRC14_002541 [Serendipita sp. 396]|nr:hypothetical protein FRC14_002541 [Serendipita sp. 396]KAG8781362.1 hypothetical protein FRC15_008859 [Serendipita sp. 397]KAG8801251.1 hypothetical protein FRC16_000971 [Serendipita sp. 398]KAG8837927.1 hypothetical protein FRC18_007270 [Serendipita sp. 400]KAG8858101.1 hypothetical protein FRB91_010404 [Serendipita sp. 411]KAG8868385.1 hypothetical protein FRC20_003510 [Serendipita sp. 405]KAG9056957.1 hypothetical protein FS842_009080 [Serendipita sp. 407]
MSVRSYSPSLSMSMPSTPTTGNRRRLSSSSRRGSTSAPDPWALATFDAPASSTSRLHIVRLPPPTKEELEKYEKEHGATSRRGSWGSAMGLSKSLSMTSVTGGGNGSGMADRSERLSFTGTGGTHMPRTKSIDANNRPKIHPASHTGPLAPQQLYDLAMNSINPRVSFEENNGGAITEPTPAVFTPLPANHYLPFIVRSSEVQQLLSQGPPRRLWALIKQIYPTNLKEESDDPTKWPFWQLERWMFKVDRHEASDRVWVRKARACISRRSETLWEKLKNALGVPYELELDGDEDSDDENAIDLDDVVGGVSDINIGTPAKSSVSPQRAKPTPDEGKESEVVAEEDDVPDEFIDMGPTGLVMEAIYPSAAPQSPVTSHGSPSKHDEGLGGMEIIGEEEEEEEEKTGAGPAAKGKSEAEAKQQDEENKQNELDPSRMVGITFISHSKYVPLQQYIEKGEASDGEAIVDSPLFPTSFASLSEPGAIHRRGSRGAFVLEQGSMSVRGPFSKGMPRREYAVSTGSESDYDG